MDRQEKDAICELWIEIFGAQEGCGYNCPQGAYDFAEVIRAEADKELADLYQTALNQAKTIKAYQEKYGELE